MDFGDVRLPSRFWRKVEIDPATNCWEWTASRSGQTGYGWYRLSGRSVNAHRVMCAEAHGPAPEGPRSFAMHSCDNRGCVNPDHLSWGSAADNAQDMARKGRGAKPRVTHCAQGHEFTEDNTYVPPGRTTRHCRECHRAWWREWNKRRREPGYTPRKGHRDG